MCRVASVFEKIFQDGELHFLGRRRKRNVIKNKGRVRRRRRREKKCQREERKAGEKR